MLSQSNLVHCAVLAGIAGGSLLASTSRGETLRVVSYNIEADISGYTTARPGLDGVLEGIGQESVNGTAEPIDILALQETTSNSTTVQPIVNDLNAYYGAGTYAMSSYQATQSGSNGDGNGPNALIYRTSSLTLLASVGVGTPQGSGNGEYRQVVRYEFQPVGGTAAQDFYVYSSHYKSGTSSSDLTARNGEAQIIRNDELTLPANARVLYLGDYNLSSSSESSYTTLTGSGLGQGFDPINMPGNWSTNSQFQGIMTESATDLRYRDDFQLVTQNVLNDSSGLQYIPGSYHAFGNNGSVGVNGNIAQSTALAGLSNGQAILDDLTTASDHLPVVADYAVSVPEPQALACLVAGGWLGLRRRRKY